MNNAGRPTNLRVAKEYSHVLGKAQIGTKYRTQLLLFSMVYIAKTGIIRIGISGWRYPPWRSVFYPAKLPQRQELEFASANLRLLKFMKNFLRFPATPVQFPKLA